MAYRWGSPHEWLIEKAQSWKEAELFQALEAVIGRLDGDSLQDLFQEEMDRDGYFKEVV